MTRGWKFGIPLLFVILAAVDLSASAQCTFLKYIVLEPTQVAIRCKEEVHTLPEFDAAEPFGGKKVADATITGLVSPYTTMQAVVRLPHNDNNHWFSIELKSGSQLSPATKYSIAITFPPPKPDVDDKPVAMAAVLIDTTSSYTVNPAKSANLATLYAFVSSTVALSMQTQGCTLKVINALSKVPHAVALEACILRNRLPNDYDNIGIVNVRLRDPLTLQAVPDSLTGVTDVFGATPSIPKTARMSVQKVPASKDLAAWYFNLTFLGATGSSPSWALDGQIIPNLVPGLHGGWEISPFVGSANVGQGSISSAKYTDTIDLGGKTARTFRPDSWIVQWTLSPGINVETDKEFDRWNGLATIDAKFNLRHLYNPQLRQQLEAVAAKVASDPDHSWTITDVPIPRFGYVFEIHGLLETGHKIRTSTVQNSDKSASLSLPDYGIARPSVQLHGLLQYRRISADCVFTGRYLAITEDSVLERKDKSLYLYQFHGWKGYQALTGAYQIDPIGHWALSVTYDNGFSPPTYSRANSVQIGLLIKY
jgi:hypothetical protein